MYNEVCLGSLLSKQSELPYRENSAQPKIYDAVWAACDRMGCPD